MRLIDSDVMLDDMQKELEKAVNDETMTEFDCKVLMTSALALKNFVNRQPTAYDVEKVVAEIKSLSGYEIYKNTFDLIIDIVKRGGNDGC